MVIEFFMSSCNYQKTEELPSINQVTTSIEHQKGPSNTGRYEYDLLRLGNSDGIIPTGIRTKELAFIRTLSGIQKGSRSIFADNTWKQRGPYNIGGRTRAFGQDIKNPNIILSGGASGGLWRSVNKGESWTRVMQEGNHYGVTCVVQDKRAGKENTWYYGTGEATGNSASGHYAFYVGGGMFKSEDNGITWSHLTSTANSVKSLNESWDLINNIAINENNISETEIYAAVYGGINRSLDGGLNWETVLEGSGASTKSMYSDIEIGESGTKYAFIAANVNNSSSGIWKSVDGTKDSWTNITPSFASNYHRMVLAIDPVDESFLYAFGYVPNEGKGYLSPWSETDTSYISLWKYDIDGDVWEDVSQNLPDRQYVFDDLNPQYGYNLVCEISPTNSAVVLVGATNLFVSTDGVSSKEHWNLIGGFKKDGQMGGVDVGYLNHHPDNHVLAFDNSNQYGLFSGHDGGLSLTENLIADEVEWSALTNGYFTTQCYTIAFNESSDDTNLLVGLQDNGSVFVNSDDEEAIWGFSLGGDGSYAAMSTDGLSLYGSMQRGNIYKLNLTASGELVDKNRLDPEGGDGYLFINPFILDPNDDNIMYLLGGQRLWRQNDLAQFPADTNNTEKQPISNGWDVFSDSVSYYTGQKLCNLKATKGTDRRLYVGAIGRMYRIDNPYEGDAEWQDISDGLKSGGFVSDIAIDPRDPDKFAVVYSNYNIYSIYYTTDGGVNYLKVAGNLEEKESGAGNGPSCRSMVIHPLNNGKTAYILGTSVGLFTTDTLIANSTVWIQVAPDFIGNVVVEMVKSRQSDHTVVVATHGNGVYSAKISNYWQLNGVEEQFTETLSIQVYPNPTSSSLSFNLKSDVISFEVINVKGQKMPTTNWNVGSNQMDISSYPRGTYILIARSKDKVFQAKIEKV